MVQRELAERLTAPKCDRALSALIHTTSDIREAFTISHNCFYPKPHITSSVIQIERKRPIPAGMIDNLKKLYQNKRKMLRHTICEEKCAKLQIDPTARIEHLSNAQIYDLTTS